MYQNADPREISSRCDVPYDAEKQEFTVSLMGVSYRISWPEYNVFHIGDDGSVSPIIGWYPLEKNRMQKIFGIALSDRGAELPPSTGKFLTYRGDSVGEKFYFKQFQGRCLFRLAFGFGGKLDKFREIMERVGAQAISSGDVGYELEFMKGLFVRLIFMGRR